MGYDCKITGQHISYLCGFLHMLWFSSVFRSPVLVIIIYKIVVAITTGIMSPDALTIIIIWVFSIPPVPNRVDLCICRFPNCLSTIYIGKVLQGMAPMKASYRMPLLSLPHKQRKSLHILDIVFKVLAKYIFFFSSLFENLCLQGHPDRHLYFHGQEQRTPILVSSSPMELLRNNRLE